MNNKTLSILIVEDETNLGETFKDYLRDQGLFPFRMGEYCSFRPEIFLALPKTLLMLS
jgi:hypothetical protein